METLIPSDDFVKQFGGSASANLVFVFAFVMIQGVRKLCSRDSHCRGKIHMCCCDFDIRDRTLREKPEVEAAIPTTEV